MSENSDNEKSGCLKDAELKKGGIHTQDRHVASDDELPAESDQGFDAVYAQCNNALNRYLSRRLNSKEDVEDMAQEVYLRFVQHYRPRKKSPLGFLYKIASNLIKDHFRRQSARFADAHVNYEDVELASPMASPEEILRSRQGIEAFNKVLETLNPTMRRVFLLHRFCGLTHEEIAYEMEISKNVVHNHIYQVLIQFRKKIPEYI
ncbi:MAG: RNA polymerase sigma factor [Deltaproteobacteria bacterium]|nr:RNA polymerase sigma factor [Deltaproteobacteria bacterium]